MTAFGIATLVVIPSRYVLKILVQESLVTATSIKIGLIVKHNIGTKIVQN